MRKKSADFKINRSTWIAMLEQDKLAEAINYYENYINKIEAESEVQEIKYSKNILVERLKKLSNKYYQEKNYSNALICYNYIYQLEPQNTTNIKNHINCLEKLEQYDLQLILAKRLIKLKKEAENYKILSNAYEKNQEYKKAIEYYNKYLNQVKRTELEAQDYNIIGCHYFNSYIKKTQNPNDAKNALEYFKKTIEKVPNNKSYLKNTIVAAMKAKDYKTEKECWDIYIKNGYADKDDEFTYCASCMRNGDIEEWAKYYGSRFEKNEPTIYPKLNKPIWSGNEDLSNSTLLVHYEQGYGDNFLMFGYMPRLVKLAKKVIYYIQNSAYDLIKNNEFGVEIHCQKTTDINKLQYDYHIPCMSIPIALHLTKENLSVDGGYIKPNKYLVRKFQDKYFNNNKFKIGIAFEGISSNSKRDIPLKKLLPLDKLENVEIYCFTKDIEDKKLKCFKHNKVINIAKDFNNFADTAAAIQNADIIISSDNCILNLAGAIGKKTIGIFNYHYEFRWYDLTGKDCGWYKSVIPIVNNEYNNWDISIQEAIELIKLSI